MSDTRDPKTPAASARRSFWAGLFTLQGAGQVSLGLDGAWTLESGGAVLSFGPDDVQHVAVRRGFVWSTLSLELDGQRVQFKGLQPGEASALQALFDIRGAPAEVARALARWYALVRGRRYLNHRRWAAWQESTADLRDRLLRAPLEHLPPELVAPARTLLDTHEHVLTRVREHNDAHVARELEACAPFFDRIESNPLTRRQREAIVTDEDNTLVIAGAGTGKTSVVVGKVAYLVKRRGVPPAEILLLAYNRDARKELEERLEARLGVDVTASTFHALGYRILGEASGRKPDVHALATQPHTLGDFIERELRAQLADTVARVPLLRHLVQYLRPYRPPGDFKTQGDYYGWLKAARIRTLRGEQVRSFEEAVLADWLYVNGIDYTYEAPYQHDTASTTHSQYRPDFTLHPQQGREEPVYVEHWGVNRDGRPAPHVDAARYRERMRWARETHRHQGTTLVETFSYDKAEGQLAERFEERLAAVGLTPRPRAAHELAEVFDKAKVFSVLAKLMATFLRHFKAGRHTIEALRGSDRGGEPTRIDSFLDVFERIYAAYERTLRDDKAIDFIDMIGMATAHVEAGRFQSPWRTVLVDEFQDMAPHRARLLQALLRQVEDPRLTVVGDDWQSIYRFAGADISLMTRFSHHFGYTASVPLDRTFRFGERLTKASATFIQDNPQQLRKVLRGTHDEGGPPIVLLPIASRGGLDREAAARLATEEIRAVLRRISEESGPGGRTSVMLLGRYKHHQPPCTEAELQAGLSGLNATFRTVHKSKGLEADYVVVLKVSSGRYGFPSEVEDDPLLSMVLSQRDEAEHAEERRLFYVALTRARRKVFLLASESMRSPFVEELMKPAYRGLVEVPGEWLDPVPCPDCGAHLVKRFHGKTGDPFWGCVHYPYCSGSMNVCAECQTGALVRKGPVYRCNNGACDASARVCPKCGEGMLRKKQNGQDLSWFWACSRWKKDKTGCDYTESIG